MMSTKFDNKLKKKIEKTEVSPSSDLWNKIEAELDEKDNKKVLVIPFWSRGLFKQAIAASVIFLMGGISAFFLFNSNGNTQSASNNTINTETIVNNIDKQTVVTINEEVKEKTTEVFAKKESSNSIKTNNAKQNLTNITNKIVSNASTILKGNNASFKNSFSNVSSKSIHINNGSTNKVFAGNQKQSAKDYKWIYDETSGGYQVVLKESNNSLNNNFLIRNSTKQEGNTTLIANNFDKNNKENNAETSLMSLIEKEKEDKIETVELVEEEDSYKQFKTTINKLNYQGLWLGPNIGYQSVFAGGEHYPGGMFGIDVGYDFGGSFGLQTGVQYAINSKNIRVLNSDGETINYKSEFNSFHVPLMMRYKFTKLTESYSRPLSLNLLAGLDYSFVDRKQLHQLGFIAAAEYDIFTQADLMLTLGIRGGVHNNLNKNKLDITEKLSDFNYSFGAYVAVRFIDWAKRK